jgi:hypothetical protein
VDLNLSEITVQWGVFWLTVTLIIFSIAPHAQHYKREYKSFGLITYAVTISCLESQIRPLFPPTGDTEFSPFIALWSLGALLVLFSIPFGAYLISDKVIGFKFKKTVSD